jgi:hypothetical protein
MPQIIEEFGIFAILTLQSAIQNAKNHAVSKAPQRQDRSQVHNNPKGCGSYGVFTPLSHPPAKLAA